MIETKHVELWGYPTGDRSLRKMYEECQQYIQDLKAFGWQPTEEVTEKHGRSSQRYQVMARETTMPNYNKYHDLEMEYEDAKSSIRTYNSMEFSTLLVLFLLLIIPCVLYIVFKNIQKARIKKNNNECHERMKAAMTEALGI